MTNQGVVGPHQHDPDGKRHSQTDLDRLTEAGSAERFARASAEYLRFDHRRRQWLIWKRHRWVADTDAAVTRAALAFAREWQREALDHPSPEQRTAVVKCAIALEGRHRLNNMLELAKAIRPIADAGETWDADPWLLGVPNGVVDLRTGTLRDGRREDRISRHTSVAYDPDATAPRWDRFLAEIFEPHPELLSFIHRAVGYSLTGDTTEQVLFVLHGTGSNGKGTFANRLNRIFGDYAWNMPFSTLELRGRSAIPNDVAALVGRRFVTASETNDGTRLNEARIKALTGCDPMTARFLHSEYFTFQPCCKFWLSVNHRPVVRDDSHGLWRRIRLIPFTRSFPIDARLSDQLALEEAGILNWAVQGVGAWRQHGLQAPEVVIEATRSYQTESDPLGGFLQEACELEANANVGAADMYDHYRRWADNAGLAQSERLSSTMFGRKFADKFEHEQTRSGRVYLGITRRSR